MSAKSHDANLFGFLEQIDRIEQFFVASGLPHLVFYYQDTELAEGGTMKKKRTLSESKLTKYLQCNYFCY